MKKISAAFLFLFLVFSNSNLQAQSYKRFHHKAFLVDTHNDVMIEMLDGKDIATDLTGKAHTDLARFKKGGVDAQFFSIWSDENYGKGKGFKYAMLQIDTLLATIERNQDKMMLAKNSADIAAALKKKKLASLIGVEGGHMIEDSIGYLETLYNRGARYLTLTWNNSTSWATSAADESSGKLTSQKKGLNDFGKQIVKRMNELGMMVDLSHVGEQTFWDAINTSTKPVLVSHSCAHAICPVPRNVNDEQIKAIAKNGGVIHLNFYAGFLDSNFNTRRREFVRKHREELDSLRKAKASDFDIEKWSLSKYPGEAAALRPPLSILIDHIDHIVKLVGVDFVGLGSDYDGMSAPPQQLDDVSTYPLITKALLQRGYSKKSIRKILGGNFMRVFKANEVKH